MCGQRHICLVVAVIAMAAVTTTAVAQDWPTWRHDASHSGMTAAQVETPLGLSWSYVPTQEPRVAWPEPGREVNRLTFDYAPQVAVADGAVFFGSTADHAVRAIDLATGRLRWRFFTDAPVRLAPMVVDGRVYVGSDDGTLYCLGADDGSVVWSFYGAPRREMLMGNGQLISHHPLRTGVAVDDGVAYFTAGMWPSDGVYVYALDADDGTVLWRNSTSGQMYVRHPHPPAKSMSGVAPQGHILLDDDQLFVPTGRNVPAAFDRATGELQYYHPGPDRWADRWGGTWLFTADDMLFCWRSRPNPDVDVQMTEHEPFPKDGMAGMEPETGRVVWEFIGKLDAVLREGILYASGAGSISAHSFEALLDGEEPDACRLWSAEHGRVYALIMAGDTLFAGGRGEVTAVAADDGEVLWREEVEGDVYGLAAADGRLLVSLDDGRVLCYGAPGGQPVTVQADAGPPATDETAARRARRILEQTGVTEGFCVDLGCDGGQLARELARQSDLRVWSVDADAGRVADARELLDAAALYGTRVTVHKGTLESLGYPQHFADLVICDRGAADEAVDAASVHRVLKPGGGVAYIAVDGPDAFDEAAGAQRWLRAGRVPGAEIAQADGALTVQRAPLKGIGRWTHQYGTIARTGTSTDEAVRLPLRMQWFGRPGPAMMISRHWRGPAPLSIDGRLFVIGQFRITALDAYNGRHLWERDLPLAGRFPVSTEGGNAAVDREAIYVAVNSDCLRLDAETGETQMTYTPPVTVTEGENAPGWDYLGVTEELVLGTVGDGAPLFALDKETGQVRWTYEPEQSVGHDSVAVGGGCVYAIDAATPAQADKLRRRGEPTRGLSRLVALDAGGGGLLWATPAILPRRDLRLSQDVLLATGGGRMSAYDAETGDILSWGDVSMQRFPVIVGDTIYGQPHAYDLATGRRLQREHPLTGAMVPWSMSRSYGCGSVSGAPNLLAFRSGTLGFYDIVGDSGIHNYGAIRAGCYVNAIIAQGMVLMPPADAACTCSYNFQTTVALAPTDREEEWPVFATGGEVTPLEHASLNFGAPGDRRAEDGTLWLAIPRPAGVVVPIEIEQSDDGDSWHLNADETMIAGSARPWLHGTGMEGIEGLTLKLGHAEPETWRVRLHFAEPEMAAGERVFDVLANGETVLQALDVCVETGGTLAALQREFTVEAADELRLEFARGSSSGAAPMLSGLEIMRR